jgi:hypothetical protein
VIGRPQPHADSMTQTSSVFVRKDTGWNAAATSLLSSQNAQSPDNATQRVISLEHKRPQKSCCKQMFSCIVPEDFSIVDDELGCVGYDSGS